MNEWVNVFLKYNYVQDAEFTFAADNMVDKSNNSPKDILCICYGIFLFVGSFDPENTEIF